MPRIIEFATVLILLVAFIGTVVVITRPPKKDEEEI